MEERCAGFCVGFMGWLFGVGVLKMGGVGEWRDASRHSVYFAGRGIFGDTGKNYRTDKPLRKRMNPKTIAPHAITYVPPVRLSAAIE